MLHSKNFVTFLHNFQAAFMKKEVNKKLTHVLHVMLIKKHAQNNSMFNQTKKVDKNITMSYV